MVRWLARVSFQVEVQKDDRRELTASTAEQTRIRRLAKGEVVFALLGRQHNQHTHAHTHVRFTNVPTRVKAERIKV